MIRPLLCALLLLLVCSCELITVETSRGAVQGFDHDFGNDTSKRFYGYGQVFLGIPFAVPPLGERRFKLPEPLCRYNEKGEVHNATYYRPRCWQTFSPEPADEMSEDCLYLNVMTPNVSGNYPVLVFIHGGAFTTGGADIYHWKGAVRNLVSRGIVVVTIQYRLNMLGFFTTFTENFPPNRGFYDQIMALRWVNEEIKRFGGNPGRVTIFGQSAGACSVSNLSLSPLARGLFQQLIMNSGSSYMELETIEDPRVSNHQLRAQQICHIDSTDWGSEQKDQALLDCLVHASPERLVFFDIDMKGWFGAIDGAFLPDYPENLAKTRTKIPVLIGDMLEDYASFIPGVAFGAISKVSGRTASDIFRKNWPNYDSATIKHLTDILVGGFTNGSEPAPHDHLEWTKLITEIFTGYSFDFGMLRDIGWHQQAGNKDLWLFTFAHRSLLSFNRQIEGWIPVSHSSELPYLWFYPHVWETYNASAADLAVAERMGEMWTDFVKYGKLSHPRAQEVMNYMEISENITLKTNWRRKAGEVYNEKIPNYLGEFPPLQTSAESWKRLRKLGEKVLSQWNSMTCPSSGADIRSLSSRSAPQTAYIALTMLMLTQALRLLQRIRY